MQPNEPLDAEWTEDVASQLDEILGSEAGPFRATPCLLNWLRVELSGAEAGS